MLRKSPTWKSRRGHKYLHLWPCCWHFHKCFFELQILWFVPFVITFKLTICETTFWDYLLRFHAITSTCLTIWNYPHSRVKMTAVSRRLIPPAQLERSWNLKAMPASWQPGWRSGNLANRKWRPDAESWLFLILLNICENHWAANCCKFFFTCDEF